MAYPASKLITEAFYTSGIVSRQFQTVAGDQFATGFTKLNEILTDSLIEDDKIPYYNTGYDFNLVAGQEKYFIPKLTKLETFTFYIDVVRYSTYKKPSDKYFGCARAENIDSLPFNYNFERVPGGGNLFLYFFPQSNYTAQITGWFTLDPIQSVAQDLTLPFTTAQLGYTSINGPLNAGTITVGNLVVNGVDLAGTYNSPAQLVNQINNGGPGPIIPFVYASLINGQFYLFNRAGLPITITSSGNLPINNCVTFTWFNTTNGPKNYTYNAQFFDQFYINYLQYRLAQRLCIVYNFAFPDEAKKELLKYEQMISREVSPRDFSQSKISTLTTQNSINYAQVNIGKGWTT